LVTWNGDERPSPSLDCSSLFGDVGYSS